MKMNLIIGSVVAAVIIIIVGMINFKFLISSSYNDAVFIVTVVSSNNKGADNSKPPATS